MPIVLIMALLIPLAPLPSASVSPASASSPVSVASAQDRLVDANAAYAALESNLEAIGAKKISGDYGVYGSEQVIGIVDTGVDPLIPGFYRQGGSSKIRSWYDATSEGVANILGRYHAENGYLSVGELKLKVTNLRSLSNTYLVGLLPSSISNEFPVERKVYFVVFDPLKKGVFEAVAIDTDSDLAFGNEATLYRFDREKKAATVQLDSSRAVSLAEMCIRDSF